MVKKSFLYIFLLPVFISVEELPIIWLQPNNFAIKAGDKVSIQLTSGSNLIDEPLVVKKETLTKAEVYTSKGTLDLLPTFTEGPGKHLEVQLAEGTSFISIRSIPTVHEIPSDEFNAYLKDNDLSEISDRREATKSTDRAGRVQSSWNSTLLLQAGVLKDETFKKSTGFPLEIVPEKNPYALKAGEPIRFKILWNTKPLFGARIKIYTRVENNTGLQHVYTGKDGVVEVPFSSKGTWLVSVVKMIPARNDQAEWQSYQRTLSFGF
jgi:uncharacterized GH25 family protein